MLIYIKDCKFSPGLEAKLISIGDGTLNYFQGMEVIELLRTKGVGQKTLRRIRYALDAFELLPLIGYDGKPYWLTKQ